MSGNVLAAGDYPGNRRDWGLWRGEMRGAGLHGVRDVGGVRRLGNLGLFGPFDTEFSSEAMIPDTVPPIVIDRLGGSGLAGAGAE